MTRLLAASIAAVFTLACAQAARAHTVVIVVRHAEKAATPADDPELTEDGLKRAWKLSDIGVGAGVEVIFTTQVKRTRMTAKTLGSRLNITPLVREVTRETVDAHIRSLGREILDSHRGKTVLVVGHSNTAPRIAGFLSNQTIPDLDDATEFDAIFVVVIPDSGAPRLIRAKY